MATIDRDHDYYDFVELFREAADGQMMNGGGSVEPSRQAKALQWVEACKSRGEDFEETGEPILLGDFSGELETELTPLAWAVDQGLTLVVEALLRAGANPNFSFEVYNDHGNCIELDVTALAQGWSETGYHARDCAGLIHSAIEGAQIAACAAPGHKGSGMGGKPL